MQVLSLRMCESRNFHCHKPVIVFKLDLQGLAGKDTSQFAGFTEALINCLPGLAGHQCSTGRSGGFIDRLRQGTLFGHVVEHIALELQTEAGINVVYGKTRQSFPESVFEIVIECKTMKTAEPAVYGSIAVVTALLRQRMVDVENIIWDIRQIYRKESLGPSTAAIVQAAQQRDIPVLRLAGNSLLQLGYGSQQRRIWSTMTDRTRCLGADVAADKLLAKKFLEASGIPVPKGGIASSQQDVYSIARDIGTPVAVKPFNGNQGKGVSLDLSTPEQLDSAFRLACNHSDKVIVEQFISGRHYRILVVDNKAIAAAERIPAHVVGDGHHTIAELVAMVNEHPDRGEGHECPLTRIKIDPVVLAVLSRQNRTVNYRPDQGEIVCLRLNANLSTGGTAIDVTDLMHPHNAELAVRAAAQIGLDIAGVDIVANDISEPIDGQTGAVIEVNASPGLRMHLYPANQSPRPVHKQIINYLFPVRDQWCGRIPVVAVTGTNGKTSTVRLIAGVLEATNKVVGTATTDGVHVGAARVTSGDKAGVMGARMILMDKRVDAAVLEVARGGLIRNGLTFDASDVAVVTNVQADHLGQDGVLTITDLIHVKSLVVEAVRANGTVVLNADDPAAPLVAERAAAPITYVSISSTNPIVTDHTRRGGRAVIADDGTIFLVKGNERIPVIKISDIPITYCGRCDAGTTNSLLAIGACWGLRLSEAAIATGITRLKPTLASNKGRLNYIEVSGVRLLVDYGHNPSAFAVAAKLARRLAENSPVVAVVGVPGDRGDDQIIASGEAAGMLFDQVIIKEDADLRGRSPDEVAQLMVKGAVRAGLSPNNITVVHNEQDAIIHALQTHGQSALIVAFYELLESVTNAIKVTCNETLETGVTP